MESHHMIVPSN